MNALETHVRAVARALHDHQIARLYKIPNDIKIIDGEVQYAERTPVDFMGFTASGRVIMVECKMRNALSLGLNSSGLKPHQMIAIREAHKAGGLGLVCWQRQGQVAVLDAGQVEIYTKGRGRKSVSWKDIPEKYVHELYDDPLRFFWPFLTC
jgi:penicillin-binding protein-related factor A (putative recombinase)